MNGKQRKELAQLLQPFLMGKQIVELAKAREQLHKLMPSMAGEIDGMEAAHILRRAGYAKDYSRPDVPSTYRRVGG